MEGVVVTDRDRAMLSVLLRWGLLTPHRILALTEPDSRVWNPNADGYDSTEAERRALAVHRRLIRLAGIRSGKRGHNIGPLVDVDYTRGRPPVWWATRAAAAWIDYPWTPAHARIPTARIDHALASADVGRTLERHVGRVWSEREFKTGVAHDGTPTAAVAASLTDHDSGRRVEKVPDLVVPLTDGRWVAVEVERERDALLTKYRDKVAAYVGNTDCAGVWYFSTAPVTSRRIRDGAAKAYPPAGFLQVVDLVDLGPYLMVDPDSPSSRDLLTSLSRGS